jgi:ACS family glucarate transporter-like MFS transporter
MTTRLEEPAIDAVPFESSERPSRARYIVLFFLCLLSVVLYLDRVCIGIAYEAIHAELGIEKREWGFVLGAFTLAYGMFEVVTGHWGDRYGSRGVLTRIVVWWSVFTALTGAAIGLGSLLVVRFLFGAGEAGALPNAARVVTRWFPPEARGLARGVVITSTNIGGSLAPIVAEAMINRFGWRATFVYFGIVGCVWAAAFYWWFRDDPAEHPAVNEAERRLISGSAALAPGGEHHPPVPWARVVRSANVWLLGSAVTCASFFSYMYMFWYPTYLKNGRGVTEDTGWMSGLVLAGAGVGSVWGGFVAGWLNRTIARRKRGRRIYGFAIFTLAAFSLWASMNTDSSWGSAFWMASAAMFAYAQLPTWWSVTAEISGRHLGALFGLMNSMGVLGAFASNILMGILIDYREKEYLYSGRQLWDPVFDLYMAVLAVGGLMWLFVDASKSAVEESKP